MNTTRSTPTLHAIFFDFDGVILESVDAKTIAFRKLFAAYPRFLKRILSYHLKNGGAPLGV